MKTIRVFNDELRAFYTDPVLMAVLFAAPACELDGKDLAHEHDWADLNKAEGTAGAVVRCSLRPHGIAM